MRRGFLPPSEFDRLLELARLWETEAETCAEVKAYYGACILAAAAIEAMLLATCDLLPEETRKAKASLGLKFPVRRMGLGQLLQIAAKAGWLVGNDRDDSKPDILMLTKLVRRLRDLSHPGRHLRELEQAQLPSGAFDVAWHTIDAVREQIARKFKFDLPPKHSQ